MINNLTVESKNSRGMPNTVSKMKSLIWLLI